jgi:hypothetical protein
MGTGRKEFVKVVAEKDAATQVLKAATTQARAAIGAAESFVKSCSKTLPKFEGVEVQISSAVEEFKYFADKLDECEEQYGEAKKAKDKEKMRELEYEMKGLMQDLQVRYQRVKAAVEKVEEVVKECTAHVTLLKGVL